MISSLKKYLIKILTCVGLIPVCTIRGFKNVVGICKKKKNQFVAPSTISGNFVKFFPLNPREFCQDPGLDFEWGKLVDELCCFLSDYKENLELLPIRIRTTLWGKPVNDYSLVRIVNINLSIIVWKIRMNYNLNLPIIIIH